MNKNFKIIHIAFLATILITFIFSILIVKTNPQSNEVSLTYLEHFDEYKSYTQGIDFSENAIIKLFLETLEPDVQGYQPDFYVDKDYVSGQVCLKLRDIGWEEFSAGGKTYKDKGLFEDILSIDIGEGFSLYNSFSETPPPTDPRFEINCMTVNHVYGVYDKEGRFVVFYVTSIDHKEYENPWRDAYTLNIVWRYGETGGEVGPVLTVTTDKQSYRYGEIIRISGALTINGNPVTEGSIEIRIQDGSTGNLIKEVEVLLNDRGEYSYDFVATGDNIVGNLRISVEAHPPGYGRVEKSTVIEVYKSSLEVVLYTIKEVYLLDDYIEVAGTVNSEGIPVSGVDVDIRVTNVATGQELLFKTKTDIQGNFYYSIYTSSLGLGEYKLKVIVDVEGFHAASRETQFSIIQLGGSNLTIILEGNKSLLLDEIYPPQQYARINVSVYLYGDGVHAWLNIYVVEPSGNVWNDYVLTDENGKYVLDVPITAEGIYNVTVVASYGSTVASKSFTFNVKATHETMIEDMRREYTFNVTINTNTVYCTDTFVVSGTVIDGLGDPMVGMKINVSYFNVENPSIWGLIGSTITDRDGRFYLEVSIPSRNSTGSIIPLGEYYIDVVGYGYKNYHESKRLFKIVRKAFANLNIILDQTTYEPGETLYGQIIVDNGKCVDMLDLKYEFKGMYIDLFSYYMRSTVDAAPYFYKENIFETAGINIIDKDIPDKGWPVVFTWKIPLDALGTVWKINIEPGGLDYFDFKVSNTTFYVENVTVSTIEYKIHADGEKPAKLEGFFHSMGFPLMDADVKVEAIAIDREQYYSTLNELSKEKNYTSRKQFLDEVFAKLKQGAKYRWVSNNVTDIDGKFYFNLEELEYVKSAFLFKIVAKKEHYMNATKYFIFDMPTVKEYIKVLEITPPSDYFVGKEWKDINGKHFAFTIKIRYTILHKGAVNLVVWNTHIDLENLQTLSGHTVLSKELRGGINKVTTIKVSGIIYDGKKGDLVPIFDGIYGCLKFSIYFKERDPLYVKAGIIYPIELEVSSFRILDEGPIWIPVGSEAQYKVNYELHIGYYDSIASNTPIEAMLVKEKGEDYVQDQLGIVSPQTAITDASGKVVLTISYPGGQLSSRNGMHYLCLYLRRTNKNKLPSWLSKEDLKIGCIEIRFYHVTPSLHSKNNMVGVVADGVSTIKFTVKTNYAHFRGVFPAWTLLGRGSVKVFEKDGNTLVLLYKPPEVFDPRKMRMSDTLKIGDTEFTLKVYRPPVILIHGLWSTSETWNVMFDWMVNDGFNVSTIDWTSNGDLNKEFEALPRKIKVLKEGYLRKGINLSKVDVVGHSTGGLIARRYIADDNYKFDIRKLIMLGTPNHGSFLADLYQEFGGKYVFYVWKYLYLSYYGWVCLAKTAKTIVELKPKIVCPKPKFIMLKPGPLLEQLRLYSKVINNLNQYEGVLSYYKTPDGKTVRGMSAAMKKGVKMYNIIGIQTLIGYFDKGTDIVYYWPEIRNGTLVLTTKKITTLKEDLIPIGDGVVSLKSNSLVGVPQYLIHAHHLGETSSPDAYTYIKNILLGRLNNRPIKIGDGRYVVVKYSGNVYYRKRGGDWKELKGIVELDLGDGLYADKNSYVIVEVRWSNKSSDIITVGENSGMYIISGQHIGIQGKIHVIVSNLKSFSYYVGNKFRTHVSAGGTEISFDVKGDDAVITVVHGHVSIFDKNCSEGIILLENYTVSVNKAGKLGSPEKVNYIDYWWNRVNESRYAFYSRLYFGTPLSFLASFADKGLSIVSQYEYISVVLLYLIDLLLSLTGVGRIILQIICLPSLVSCTIGSVAGLLAGFEGTIMFLVVVGFLLGLLYISPFYLVYLKFRPRMPKITGCVFVAFLLVVIILATYFGLVYSIPGFITSAGLMGIFLLSMALAVLIARYIYLKRRKSEYGYTNPYNYYYPMRNSR